VNAKTQEHFGAAADTSLQALDLLLGEVFFSSPQLAQLASEAEVRAAREHQCSSHSHSPRKGAESPLEAYQVGIHWGCAGQRRPLFCMLLAEGGCSIGAMNCLGNPLLGWKQNQLFVRGMECKSSTACGKHISCWML
jgi:hypothetical protein